MRNQSIVLKNQVPLIEDYKIHPEKASITDVAFIEGKSLKDPFHTEVFINEELQVPFKIGVHRAVGGLHDYPNPGDLLCASLASCFESTLRLIANRLQITLINTFVRATADVDVRGTLMINKDVPVNFQRMFLEVKLKVDNDSDTELIKKLIKGTESCCIIYQTLIKALPIYIDFTLDE
ncbi:OsmC family protein [Mangrovivirga sp. M17]|uniref:OsmC family protein n=1 Tax=Mangrovivirga halotolerans TaxID=2993936 RepID=A0ABT3RQJ8_9BACT|nr:OsmC family protein [Mangrovivirga halotolerans]MCX2743823.1 OsmC family protein [Mangrovivirga halotolerans]